MNKIHTIWDRYDPDWEIRNRVLLNQGVARQTRRKAKWRLLITGVMAALTVAVVYLPHLKGLWGLLFAITMLTATQATWYFGYARGRTDPFASDEQYLRMKDSREEVNTDEPTDG